MSSDAALYIATAIITSCGSIVCGGICYFFRNTIYYGCCTRDGLLIIIRKVSNANDTTTEIPTDVPISPKITTVKPNTTKQQTTNNNRDTVTISEGGIKYSEFIGQLNK